MTSCTRDGRRGREKNRWIGLRMEDPAPDIAKLAEAQGAVGIGPVKTAAEVKAATLAGAAWCSRRAERWNRARDRDSRMPESGNGIRTAQNILGHRSAL